jgi:hypothetical protein
MTIVQAQTPERVTDHPALLAVDRCDKCNAAAMVVANFVHGELMFCGHHAIEQKINLMAKCVSIFDPNNLLFPVN